MGTNGEAWGIAYKGVGLWGESFQAADLKGRLRKTVAFRFWTSLMG